MSYKTIVVHIDHSARTPIRIQAAAAIARQEDAHLIGVAASGISRFLYGEGAMLANDPVMIPHFDLLRDRAIQALQAFATLATDLGVTSVEQRVIDDEALGGISLHGRFSDLIVLGQIDPEDPVSSLTPEFPEYVVMNSGRPVLIIPYAWTPAEIGKEVLVAWDAGLEATRAVSAAIPLLKRAANVKVVTYNLAQPAQFEGELPGNDIALYLARHGIKVNVIRRETHGKISDALLSLAAESGTNLIVMGGYGHSRFHEILLGGTTREILESMTIPVLMSH